MRLDVLLGRNTGWTSRTAARAAIAEGRVRIGGAVVEAPRHEIPEAELPFAVSLDDVELLLYDRVRLLLNKPTGCVTALRDALHPTAHELASRARRSSTSCARSAGSISTPSGLLLWTNDGAEIQRLMHPKREVLRVYQAALARPFAKLPPKLVLEDGHEPRVTALELPPPAAVHPSLQVPAEATVLATITVVGGRTTKSAASSPRSAATSSASAASASATSSCRMISRPASTNCWPTEVPR